MGAAVIKDNFGMTLYASNNDCARPSLAEEIGDNCYQDHFPASSVAEALQLKTMGEVQYDKRQRDEALEWIRGHQRRFAQLTGARAVQFWFPRWAGGVYHRSLWLITALAFGGLALMFRRHPRPAMLVLGIFFFYPLVYYIVVTDVRYRYPILWLSLLTAGYLVAAAIDQPAKDSHHTERR
jgi:hypothetical protein